MLSHCLLSVFALYNSVVPLRPFFYKRLLRTILVVLEVSVFSCICFVSPVGVEEFVFSK